MPVFSSTITISISHFCSIERGSGDICFKKYGLAGTGGLSVEQTGEGSVSQNVKLNNAGIDKSVNGKDKDGNEAAGAGSKLALLTSDGKRVYIAHDSPLCKDSTLLQDLMSDAVDSGGPVPVRFPERAIR